MEMLGFIFGMMGMSLGLIGLIFGVICVVQMRKLIRSLKEKGILEETYEDT
jgi:hypothetical protein|tara:strand:+ start:129 stop:281 length:153 start_codon:yes stop_codon:yes gene_type:complete